MSVQGELEKLVDERVRKAMPDSLRAHHHPWLLGFSLGSVFAVFMLAYLGGNERVRVERLDGRLTELHDFAHGIAAAGPIGRDLSDDQPAVPILPRPHPELLPEPKETP